MGFKFDNDEIVQFLIGGAFIIVGILGMTKHANKSFSMSGVTSSVVVGGRAGVFSWKLPFLTGFIAPGAILFFMEI